MPLPACRSAPSIAWPSAGWPLPTYLRLRDHKAIKPKPAFARFPWDAAAEEAFSGAQESREPQRGFHSDRFVTLPTLRALATARAREGRPPLQMWNGLRGHECRTPGTSTSLARRQSSRSTTEQSRRPEAHLNFGHEISPQRVLILIPKFHDT